MMVTPSRTLIERVIFTLAPITIDGAQLIIFYLYRFRPGRTGVRFWGASPSL
jgi:hypothetical protein